MSGKCYWVKNRADTASKANLNIPELVNENGCYRFKDGVDEARKAVLQPWLEASERAGSLTTDPKAVTGETARCYDWAGAVTAEEKEVLIDQSKEPIGHGSELTLENFLQITDSYVCIQPGLKGGEKRAALSMVADFKRKGDLVDQKPAAVAGKESAVPTEPYRKKTFEECDQLFSNITNALDKIPGKIMGQILKDDKNAITQINDMLGETGWGIAIDRETIEKEKMDLDVIYGKLQKIDEELAKILIGRVKLALDTIAASLPAAERYQKIYDCLAGNTALDVGANAQLRKLIGHTDVIKKTNLARLIKAVLLNLETGSLEKKGDAKKIDVPENKAFKDKISAEKAAESLGLLFPIVDEFYSKVTSKCPTPNPAWTVQGISLTFDEAQAIAGLDKDNVLPVNEGTLCCETDKCPSYDRDIGDFTKGTYRVGTVPGVATLFQDILKNVEDYQTTIVDGNGASAKVALDKVISPERGAAIAAQIKKDANVIQQQNVADATSTFKTVYLPILLTLGTLAGFGGLQYRAGKKNENVAKEQGKLFAQATLADFKLSDIELPAMKEAQEEFKTSGKFSRPYFDERGDLVELTKVWFRTGGGAKRHIALFSQSQSGKSAIVLRGLPQMIVLAKLSPAELDTYFETMKKDMSSADFKVYEECTRRAVNNYNSGLADPAVQKVGSKGFKPHPISWGKIKEPGGSMQDAANTAWGRIVKECAHDVKEGYIPILVVEEAHSGENDKIIKELQQAMKLEMADNPDCPRVVMITTVKEAEALVSDTALTNRVQPKMIMIPKPTTTNRFLKETKAIADTGVTNITDEAMNAIYLLGNETNAKASSVTCADEYLQNLASYAKDRGVTSIDFNFVMQFQRERYPGQLGDLKTSELEPMIAVMEKKLERGDRATEARLNMIIAENTDGEKATIGEELKRMRETRITDATALLAEVGGVSYDSSAPVDKAALLETIKAITSGGSNKATPKNQEIIVDIIERQWTALPEERKNMFIARDAFDGIEIKSGKVPQIFVIDFLQKMGIKVVDPVQAAATAKAQGDFEIDRGSGDSYAAVTKKIIENAAFKARVGELKYSKAEAKALAVIIARSWNTAAVNPEVKANYLFPNDPFAIITDLPAEFVVDAMAKMPELDASATPKSSGRKAAAPKGAGGTSSSMQETVLDLPEKVGMFAEEGARTDATTIPDPMDEVLRAATDMREAAGVAVGEMAEGIKNPAGVLENLTTRGRNWWKNSELVEPTEANLARYGHTEGATIGRRTLSAIPREIGIGGLAIFLAPAITENVIGIDPLERPATFMATNLGVMHTINAGSMTAADVAMQARAPVSSVLTAAGIRKSASLTRTAATAFGSHLTQVGGLASGVIWMIPGSVAGQKLTAVFTDDPVKQAIGATVGGLGLPTGLNIIFGRQAMTKLATKVGFRAIPYVGWALLADDLLMLAYEELKRSNMKPVDVQIRERAIQNIPWYEALQDRIQMGAPVGAALYHSTAARQLSTGAGQARERRIQQYSEPVRAEMMAQLKNNHLANEQTLENNAQLVVKTEFLAMMQRALTDGVSPDMSQMLQDLTMRRDWELADQSRTIMKMWRDYQWASLEDGVNLQRQSSSDMIKSGAIGSDGRITDSNAIAYWMGETFLGDLKEIAANIKTARDENPDMSLEERASLEIVQAIVDKATADIRTMRDEYNDKRVSSN